MTYDEALDYLSGFQFHGFRLGLERTENILKALHSPHLKYPCIHVAGTNGKGSVCAMLTQILTEAGYRTGLYTSPHLFSLAERFRTGSRQIEPDELAAMITRIRSFVEKGYELSYFEYTTAIAFQWFREKAVDIAILETGLGGRLDATNVITPLVSVITNIGLDHQTYLGNSLEEIAREKAGIIKPGVPVISGVTGGAARKVIEETCNTLRTKARIPGRDFEIVPAPGGLLTYREPGVEIRDITPGLMGSHQAKNTALAVAAIRQIRGKGFEIPDDAIRKGCANVKWPGRGELINGPVRILLDGAHNPDGVQSLKGIIRDMRPAGRSCLLWACSNEGGSKDYRAMLNDLEGFFDRIIITEPPGPRAPVSVSEWSMAGLDCRIVLEQKWETALLNALETLEKGDFLCVAGSLYLVGAVRNRIMKMNGTAVSKC